MGWVITGPTDPLPPGPGTSLGVPPLKPSKDRPLFRVVQGGRTWVGGGLLPGMGFGPTDPKPVYVQS